MFYAIVRMIIGWWAGWYLRLTVVGRGHMPKHGGVLVAGNHVSYLDIPMLACAVDRPLDFMGKAELFRHPFMGWCYRRLGGFPVRRGGVTKEALSEAIRRLQAGRAVVIYPEGQINLTGALLPAKPGIGSVVARAGVPVVPVYVVGTDEAMPRGSWWIRPRRVTVLVGPPLTFASTDPGMGNDQRARHEEIGRRVMHGIDALRRQSLHRVAAQNR
jgi:1-acyl-sn-glycerol-3-phosphate acyltransferase